MNKRCDLIYGQPGIGKTILASTALEVEELRPILMLMTDDTDSIESKVHLVTKKTMGEPQHDKLNVFPIIRWPDVADAYDFLCTKEQPYKTVIIDTMTELGDLSLDFAQGHVSSVRLTTIDDPDRAEYRTATNLMLDFLRGLKILPDINVIMTAHVDVRKSEITELSEVKPAFTRKLSSAIPGKAKTVIYMSVDGKNRRVATFQPRGRITAKDLSEGGRLGTEMVDPSYTKIMEKLKNGSSES